MVPGVRAWRRRVVVGRCLRVIVPQTRALGQRRRASAGAAHGIDGSDGRLRDIVRRGRIAVEFAASAPRSSFPAGVCGSRGTKAICRGRLCGASRASTSAREPQSSGGGERSATSSAATVWPQVSSGSPNTAAAVMPGQRSSSAPLRPDTRSRRRSRSGRRAARAGAGTHRVEGRRGPRCRTTRPAPAAAHSSTPPSASGPAPRCARRRCAPRPPAAAGRRRARTERSGLRRASRRPASRFR